MAHSFNVPISTRAVKRADAQNTDSDAVVFHVDETSDLPIWVQLRNRIAYLIRTGHYAPGEQLPSVRSLAATANINYNTVTKAYRDLELSGMIVSLRGRGMFVQKSITFEDDEREAADALFDSCLQQYRSCGMTFQEIRERVVALIDEREETVIKADEEKREYGTP